MEAMPISVNANEGYIVHCFLVFKYRAQLKGAVTGACSIYKTWMTILLMRTCIIIVLANHNVTLNSQACIIKVQLWSEVLNFAIYCI